jgi:hypothetical protein
MTDLSEAVARAMVRVIYGAPDDYDIWDAIGDRDRNLCSDLADAAIAAIWPRAMERAAEVAQGCAKYADRNEIAAAIRAEGAPK